MSTSTEYRGIVVPAIFDNSHNAKMLSKYTNTSLLGKRLRGNDSLNAPGFTFEDSEEVYIELGYKGIDKHGCPIIKDGFYGVNDQKHLLYSDRSVFEVFNFLSTYVPTQTSIRHLCSYKPDYEHIEVVTFERRDYDLIKHLYSRVSTFTLNTGESSEYQYSHYRAEAFNTSRREFKLDTHFSTSLEVILNRVDQFVSRITATNTDLSEWTSILDYDDAGNHKVLFPYYPLDTSQVQVFTWDSASTNLASWIQTDTIASTSTSHLYTLNRKEGIAYLNTNVSYETAYLGYATLPAVIYYLDQEHDSYSAHEEKIGRIVDDPKSGSYFLTLDHEPLKRSELLLNIEGANLVNNKWSGVYYNQPWKKVDIRLISKDSLDPITSEKIEISLLNKIGKVQNSTLYTDQDGKAAFYYKPANFREAFLYGSTSNSTTFSHTNIQYLDTSFQNAYLYAIWKDDPLIGSTSTSTNEDSISWDSALLNGRKVIFYHWNTSIYNPVTNTQGAYSPVRPVSKSSTNLYFDTSLPTYDSTDTTVKIGGLALIGDLDAQIRLTYLDQTATCIIQNQLSREQRGEAEYLGKTYSFGFRIYSTNLSVSDTLNAANYLTINPFNSKYVILFEGGYYKDISNNIDFKFTIV